MPVLSRKKCNFAIQKEATRRLSPSGLSEDDLIPMEIFEELEIPESFNEFSEFWAVNAGRNINDIIDEGVPVVDATAAFEMVTGIPLYYCIGKCVTTPGVAEISSFDTVADVAGSLNDTYFLFTVVDSNTNDVDYYCWFNINAAGTDPALANKTGIEIAAATNVTANDLAAAIAAAITALASVTCTNPGAPAIDVVITNDELGSVTNIADGPGGAATNFLNIAVDTPGVDNVHAITEDDDNDPPSFSAYFQQLFATPALQELIGLHCNVLTINMKKDAHVKGSFEFKVPKTIASGYNAGAALTTLGKDTIGGGVAGVAWTAFKYPERIFEWAHVQGSYTLTLDAGDYLGGGAVNASGYPTESFDVTISNDMELLPVMMDPNFDDPSYGKREYEIKLFTFPESDIYRLLRKENPRNYSCTLVLKIARAQRDYVQLTFSNLYVKDVPNKIPSMDDKSVGFEVTLANNVGGTCVVEVKDKRGKIYYEVI